MTAATKQVTITTLCLATCRESWRATVPADWTEAQIREAFHADELPLLEYETQKVYDEQDRDILDVEAIA